MAMSFSRPDPASPAQVADASFPTARRGFDQNEVRDFLRMIGAEMGRLLERERFLERELESSRANPDIDAAKLDDAALTRLLGAETARVLNAARESAAEIRDKAEQSAARMILEASEEAARMREEAEIESSRRRADAAADAEAELSMAKQQGREMVNEARAYRERVLSELARRRELAREQIEQLVKGRDRLIQVFERARLVAVDVVAEMQPLGEPEEYVNLQPSTGPVPVMVARAATDDSAPLVRPADPTADPTEDGIDGAVDTDPADADPTAELDATPDGVPDAVPAEADADVDAADAADLDPSTAPTGPVDAPYDLESEPPSPDQADDATDDPSVDAGSTTDVELTELTEGDHAPADGDDDTAEVLHLVDEGSVTTQDAPADVVDTSSDVDHEPDAGDDATDTADADAADDAPARSSADPDDGSVDDVVVDLFARLRADATQGITRAPAIDPSDIDLSNTDPSDVDPSVDSAGDVAEGGSTTEPVIDLDLDVALPAAAADPVIAEIGADEAHDESTDDQPGGSPFERRDAELAPLIASSARKLKRVLADEQNEVLDALRRSAEVRTLDDLLPWASEHAGRYSSVIADDLLLAAGAGASIVETGRAATLSRAAGGQAVADASQLIGRWLVEPLRDRLERCVADGDGDNPAITKKVRSVYREWKTQHIDDQIDDIVRTAHGRGLLAALVVDTPIEWTPDPDRRACPDCDDNRLAGAVAAGQAFPTGHTSTPAHPGCRCMLVPTPR